MAASQADGIVRTGYHHGDLEQALVAEALNQVRTRGADAVSLRQVAQVVGVSPSAAYAHFPDKTALMTAVGERGMAELDARMVAAAQAVPGDDDLAAIARFRIAGETYVRFAIAQPHLFRHMFGPACQKQFDGVADHEQNSVSYQVLCRGLDDLESRGLLRPGTRDGLDLVAWTMVHGFASLVLDDFLAAEVGEHLIGALARLALSDAALALGRT